MIQSHLKEVQGKFYEKFVDLEEEVKQRDVIIVQLQTRIHELEHGRGRPGQLKDTERDSKDRPSSGGSGSSNELPFMVNFQNFYNMEQMFSNDFDKITAW